VAHDPELGREVIGAAVDDEGLLASVGSHRKFEADAVDAVFARGFHRLLEPLLEAVGHGLVGLGQGADACGLVLACLGAERELLDDGGIGFRLLLQRRIERSQVLLERRVRVCLGLPALEQGVDDVAYLVLDCVE
jgi:hypothetical protein